MWRFISVGFPSAAFDLAYGEVAVYLCRFVLVERSGRVGQERRSLDWIGVWRFRFVVVFIVAAVAAAVYFELFGCLPLGSCFPGEVLFEIV